MKFIQIVTLISVSSVLACNLNAALNAPTGVTASVAGPATIALSWTDNESTEEQYVVQRDDSGWATIATLPANSTVFYDRGLGIGSSHRYRIQAINTSDVSAYAESGVATTMAFKPNIIFFLADDMGYKDIVALRNEAIDGPTIYETPALDSFIESSALNINNAYCSGPKCVVARRSIQVGKYDWRPEVIPNNDWYLDHANDAISGGLYAGGISVNPDTIGQVIPDNETYGEAMQAAGYRTCFVGKYHLGESSTADTPVGYSFGDQPGRGPIHQGYNVSIGAGHAGAPPASYFAVENLNDAGVYTFELPDLDGATYGTSAPVEGEYITDRLTAKAIGFIDDALVNHSSQPFHLTLAHYAVHTPAEAQNNSNAPEGKGYEYFQAKKASMAAEFANHPAGSVGLISDSGSKNRVHQSNAVYAAMMKSYDASFDTLWSYLQTTDDPRNIGKKLSETTVIVISSDHGGKSTTSIDNNKPLEDDSADEVNPAPVPLTTEYRSAYGNAYSFYPTSNYPYRQGKTWSYEGGLKVPLIVYVPGITTGGAETDAFVHHADLFASFVDMAGGTQSSNSTDSVSFMLTAAEPSRTARDEMFHFFTNANEGTANPAMGAYRKGDYKLVYFMIQRRVELYNLVADPYERDDLSNSRPELAAEMLNELYQQVLSTGFSMPKPGSNSWNQEQAVFVVNGLIPSLPAVPDANPSWVGAGVTQLSKTTVELNWDVNASNATHSVVHRRADAEGETNFREVAFLPAGVTTYRDYNLVPGTTYRYRVESENFGGWAAGNTGNKSLTLLNPGPGNLSIDAVDDSVTTTPGELRCFNPLLNDQGEGALTITSITQPTEGTATLDGKWIRYQASDGFSGAVTMTYTIEDAAGQRDTASVIFILPISESEASIERWDYDDATAVRLGATSSDQGTVFSDITSDSVLTDGDDLLVFSLATGIANSSKTTTSNVAGAPYTSGKYRLEYRIDSADLTHSAKNVAIGFAFRDDGNPLQEDLGLLRIRKVDDGASGFEIHLQLQVHNGSNYTVATLYDFDSLVISDVTVAMEIDLDSSPVQIESFISLSGGEFQSLGTHASNPVAVQFDRLKAQCNISGMLSTDSVAVDYLELSEILSEPTLYSAWVTTYPWLGVLNRDSNDDPDLDGMNNFMEFALGLDPIVANTNPVTIHSNEGTPQIRFTPVRDTSVLDYAVQFSTDLSDWSSIPKVPVVTAEGVPVVEDLPASTRAFARVSVSE